MSSPKGKKRSAVTSFPVSPTHLINPLMTFLNSNKTSVIQRTLQSRKLYNKINKVNEIISDERIKWASQPNMNDSNNNNEEKIASLLNRQQTPLQINSKIRMKKTIENLMKMNNIEKANNNFATSIRTPKNKKFLSISNRNEKDENFEDYKQIKKSIKQISQISKYFDKVYKIDKKQKYLKIDTLDYWKKIETTPTKKRELLEIYNKVHKDERFTFSVYQREYEEKWLDILKNLQEKDKPTILFLINGGHHEENEDELIKNFDPNKIIQKLEYKFAQEEKKKPKKQDFFIPIMNLPVELKSTNSKEIRTDRQNSRTSQNKQIAFSNPKDQANLANQRKQYVSYQEMNHTPSIKKPVSSFDNFPEMNSPIKTTRSHAALKSFLNENMKPINEKNPKNEKITDFQSKRSRFSVETENGIQKEKKPIKLNKSPKITIDLNSSNNFQECFCKHAHNIQIYKLKKNHKSIFKIPSILPTTKKTFTAIRRASNMPYKENEVPKLNFKSIQQINELNQENQNFLQFLKTNIDESYEKNNSTVQKNDLILEK